MSEILSRTVFETCLADQTEAPWEVEVRMLLAHDAALRADNRRLREWRTEADCRYTMGDVAEMSGSHCPWEKPCDRCRAERENARLREALGLIDGECRGAVPCFEKMPTGRAFWCKPCIARAALAALEAKP